MGIDEITDVCQQQLQAVQEGSWEPQEADRLRDVLAEMMEEVRRKSWAEGVEQARLRKVLGTRASEGRVEMVQPHKNSALVAVVEAGGDRVVVKSRGQYADKSRREEAHYKVAKFLNLDCVVAPCLAHAVPLRSGPVHTFSDVLREVILESYGDVVPPPVEYFSVEAFVTCNPWEREGIAKTFANEKGFCDLQSAFLSTPLGQLYDGDDTLLLKSSPSDYEFVQLIEGLSQEHLEQLVLLNIITLQRDGTPVNLMLQELVGGGWKLVAIDNTRTFGDIDESTLEISTEEDDSRHASYWYPCALGLPGTLKPVSKALRERIASWDPKAVEAFVKRHLTYNNVPDAAAADRCARRVAKIKSLLAADPTTPLKRLAFEVVPSWEEDWDFVCEEGELGPLPDLQELAELNDPLSMWVEDERAYNRKVMYTKLSQGAGLVGCLAVGVWALTNYIRRTR